VAATVAWTAQTGKPLGGIIPAAGVGHPGLILDKQLRPVPLDSVDFVLSINLRGTLDLVRQLLPHLAAVEPEGADGERGVVIMVASAAAFEGQMGQVVRPSLSLAPVAPPHTPRIITSTNHTAPPGLRSKQRRRSVHDAPHGARPLALRHPRRDGRAQHV
jgi:NAD(P)-dependent dehydrogenase (short-subunit alcohol dehydrogenase family)